MTGALKLFAGPAAIDEIRQKGLTPERVRVVVGASGGPKWLSLARLDRVVFNFLANDQEPPRAEQLEQPVFLLGSSIGSWRMSCLARTDPVRVIADFEDYYTGLEWQLEGMSAAQVSAATAELLDWIFAAGGAEEIVSNPRMRLNVMAVRSRGLMATRKRPLLATGLMMVAAGNALSRRSLGGFFERALFSDPRDVPPFATAVENGGFPMKRIDLSAENCRDAVLATSSIPLVMEGVAGIKGAPAGVYRDGGFIDYHFDLPFMGDRPANGSGGMDGIVLYPHYRPRLIPGWFDKPFRSRRPASANLNNVLMLTPSEAFIASLTGGKLPDRDDFKRYENAERTRIWRAVANESQRLADEFHDLLATGRIAERLEPFPY